MGAKLDFIQDVSIHEFKQSKYTEIPASLNSFASPQEVGALNHEQLEKAIGWLTISANPRARPDKEKCEVRAR